MINGNSDHTNLEVLTENLNNSNNSANSSFEPEITEVKPKVREWEKHKAPWLEEMKLNQAKRTSTSPGPEQNKLKLTPDKTEEEHKESKSCKTSPYEESSPVDMSKSIPPFCVQKHERNSIPILKAKPVQPTARPQSIQNISPSNEVTPVVKHNLPMKVSPIISSKSITIDCNLYKPYFNFCALF